MRLLIVKKVYLDEIDKPNLTRLIQEFMHTQQYPESISHDIPNLPPFYEKITVHTSVITSFFAPSDLSGISGMKHEHIHTINRWRNGPSCFDTLFVNAAPDDMDDDSYAHGIQGLEVAHTHLVFSFTLDGVKYPCTLVHWFSQTTDMLSDITGMYVVEPHYLPNGRPFTAVIHLDTVFRAVHFLPVFSNHPLLLKHQQHEQTLVPFSQFYINKYIDHHAFEVIF